MDDKNRHRGPRFIRARIMDLTWRRLPDRLREAVVWAWADKFLVTVNGVCLNPRGHVLLLEQRFVRHEDHRWNLPGGFIRHGEHPEEGLLREIREETGLAATVVLPLYAFHAPKQVHLSYLCFVPDREPIIDVLEIAGYEWIALSSADPRRRRERERAAQLLPAVWPT